jgi:branched-chain amino acid aminotransferase
MNIETKKTEHSRLGQTDFDNLTFGATFSDHMLDWDFYDGKWQTPRIVPYGPIEIYPSMSTLHYGQAIFEGMKAFRTKEGTINVFRADKNFERQNKSCERMCIPTVETEKSLECLKELIRLDREWIPAKRGCSLYIRPLIFASDNFLGVGVSDKYKYMIITSPVSSYFKGGMNPIRLCTSGEFVRAAKGGLGEVKTPANYAASLYPAQKAKEKGFSQVLWLDAIEKRYIDEAGTTNIFFMIDGELVTPPLDGTILPGVTRDSVIQIARNLGYTVSERRIAIDEVFQASKNNKLSDVFCTGTAAVISPVGEIEHNGEAIIINGGKTGATAQQLYDEVTAIQYGEKEDKFGWNYKIN